MTLVQRKIHVNNSSLHKEKPRIYKRYGKYFRIWVEEEPVTMLCSTMNGVKFHLTSSPALKLHSVKTWAICGVPVVSYDRDIEYHTGICKNCLKSAYFVQTGPPWKPRMHPYSVSEEDYMHHFRPPEFVSLLRRELEHECR